MSSTSPPRGAEGNGYDNGTATTHPTTDDQQAVTYVCYWLRDSRPRPLTARLSHV